MFIAARTQMFWDMYPLEEAVEKIAQLGFSGVEICLENRYFKPQTAYISDITIKKTKKKLEEAGLQEVSIGCHSDFVHFDMIYEYIKSAIPKTRDFGAKIFILGAAERHVIQREKPGWDEETEMFEKRLRSLCDIAEDSGVMLAPEPEIHCILRTSQDLLDLMDRIHSPALGVNFDIGHSFLTDPDPIGMIHTFGDKIVHTHIENMYRGWHNHQLPIPGNGDMELALYFKALKDISFKGNLALDLYNHNLEQVATECIRSLTNIMTNIKC